MLSSSAGEKMSDTWSGTHEQLDTASITIFTIGMVNGRTWKGESCYAGYNIYVFHSLAA